MPLFSIHVTAVLRSQFVVLPTLTDPWDGLMGSVRSTPLLKRENSFEKAKFLSKLWPSKCSLWW